MTEEELYAKIVGKYPQYSKVPQSELMPRIYSKYPQYKSSVNVPERISNESGFLRRGAIKGGDVPYISAKGASGLLAGAPEFLASRPIAGAWQGISPSEFSLFPKPVSEQGRRMGEDVGLLASLAPTSEFAGAIPGLKRAFDITRAGGYKGAIQKAGEEAVKLLQPSQRQLNVSSKLGQSIPPYISEVLPYIKKSKRYGDLSSLFGKGKLESITERNRILAEENFTIRPGEYLKPLRSFISEARKSPLYEESDIKKLLEIQARFRKKTGSVSRLEAQALKEKLQDETEPLLKKMAAGEPTQRSSAELKGLGQVRYGLKRAIEVEPTSLVARLNRRWKNLNEAEKLANAQMNLDRTYVSNPRSVIEGVNVYGTRVVPRVGFMNLFRGGKAPRDITGSTSKIENLINMAREDIAERAIQPTFQSQIGSLRPRQLGYTPVSKTPLLGGQTQKLISGPQRKLLTAPRKLYGEGFQTLTPQEVSIIERTKQYPELKYMIEQFLKGE